MHPQFACRPIKVQVRLSDPFPFANVPAFGEVLETERAGRARFYADPEWRARARREVRDDARGFGEERIGSTDHVE